MFRTKVSRLRGNLKYYANVEDCYSMSPQKIPKVFNNLCSCIAMNGSALAVCMHVSVCVLYISFTSNLLIM